MKLITSIMLFTLAFNSYAEKIQSRVNSIESEGPGQVSIIKMENGRVVFLDEEDADELAIFKSSLKSKIMLEVEVDEENSFVSALTLNKTISPDFKGSKKNKSEYQPTVLRDLTEASGVFSRLRRNYQRRSECYNKAHIWAYEEYLQTGTQSMKLFLFFTSRYIRNYRHKWWFHVAPMTPVNQGEANMEMVFDRVFTRGPIGVRSWTDLFIRSGRSCPVVGRYTDYSQNQTTEDCYLIPVSMYFWQPRDIEYRDRTGFEKTQFIKSEVGHAYWEAF